MYKRCPKYCLKCQHLRHDETNCWENSAKEKTSKGLESVQLDLRILLNKMKGKVIDEAPENPPIRCAEPVGNQTYHVRSLITLEQVQQKKYSFQAEKTLF